MNITYVFGIITCVGFLVQCGSVTLKIPLLQAGSAAITSDAQVMLSSNKRKAGLKHSLKLPVFSFV